MHQCCCREQTLGSPLARPLHRRRLHLPARTGRAGRLRFLSSSANINILDRASVGICGGKLCTTREMRRCRNKDDVRPHWKGSLRVYYLGFV